MMTFENRNGMVCMCTNIWWTPKWGFHMMEDEGGHACIGYPKSHYDTHTKKWVEEYPDPLVYAHKWIQVKIGEAITEIYELLLLAPGWRAFVRHPVGWQQEAL